jgi:hypothetical protein
LSSTYLSQVFSLAEYLVLQDLQIHVFEKNVDSSSFTEIVLDLTSCNCMGSESLAVVPDGTQNGPAFLGVSRLLIRIWTILYRLCQSKISCVF